MVRVLVPSATAATRGVAELRILDFKTTWFQKPYKSAAVRGKAELHILHYLVR